MSHRECEICVNPFHRKTIFRGKQTLEIPLLLLCHFPGIIICQVLQQGIFFIESGDLEIWKFLDDAEKIIFVSYGWIIIIFKVSTCHGSVMATVYRIRPNCELAYSLQILKREIYRR